MKKTVILLGLILAVMLILAACDNAPTAVPGDEGPAEAAASDESPEAVVVSDDDGVSDASCSDCHNDTTLIVSKEVQWEASLHGSGMTFERNGADCAICHTSEGFTERVAGDTFEISADIQNSSPINCRTCHNIHDTYTSTDWALTTTEPVTFELQEILMTWEIVISVLPATSRGQAMIYLKQAGAM